jgi:hypothetical protein
MYEMRIRSKDDIGYVLHSFKDDRIATHAKVVICAPYLDLFIRVICMSDWKLGCEAVDIIEVTVGFVLVLFIQLVQVELFIIEISREVGSCFRLEGSLSGGFCGGSLMERTTFRRILLFIFCFIGSDGEFLSPARGFKSSRSMGAFFGVCTGPVIGRDAILFVDLTNFSVCGDRGIGSNDLARANGKSRAHDGAVGGFLGQPRDGREARRRRRA